MYCPNCGSPNEKNHNYCRFCGFSLIETAKSYKNQLAFGKKATDLKASDTLKRRINSTSKLLVSMMVIGLISFLLLDSQNVKWFTKISLGVFFAFQLLQFAISNSQRRRVVETNDEPPNFKAKDTAKFLEEKPFQPIMSVTETTTELLYVEKMKPQTSGELR